MRPRIEPFDKARHDRSGFECGESSLDRYLAQQATQDIRRDVASLFCFVDETSGRVGGYYTLCASSALLADIPAELSRRLPPYRDVPAVLLGRLAVRRDLQGAGAGQDLLFDAIVRSRSLPIAAWCLLVDAINERAAAWYASYGFAALTDSPTRLLVPLSRPIPPR